MSDNMTEMVALSIEWEEETGEVGERERGRASW